MKKRSGVLLPLFSLPGRFGIGTLGAGARGFLDKLSACGFSLWQILPFCPPDAYRSPYSGRSSFAADTAYIDPDELVAAGLLRPSEAEAAVCPPSSCVAGDVAARRAVLLAAAAARADRASVEQFLHENPETASYCRLAAAREEIPFFTLAFGQYEFHRQWQALRLYAAARGIAILGDLPIYSAPESYDTLAYPKAYRQGGDVAGAPPDMFSHDGQVWGNPLYDYGAGKADAYALLRARLAFLRERFDGLRLDHFRGYSGFYAIPQGAKATEGRWEAGPGQAFLDTVRDLTEGYPIIAEDLGVIDEATVRLREDNGFLSTRVFRFAFLGDPESPHLPHNYREDCAAYSGTHDNETLAEYLGSLTKEESDAVGAYCRISQGESLSDAVIRTLLHSAAGYVILPLADLLGMGAEARINVPGRAEGNWRFRIGEEALSRLDVARYRRLLTESDRI